MDGKVRHPFFTFDLAFVLALLCVGDFWALDRTSIRSDMERARYQPRGLGSHMVLVEVEFDAGGSIVDAKIVRSAQGFDAEALEAARRWRWRPARRKGGAVASVAYILFGFREPVAKIRL